MEAFSSVGIDAYFDEETPDIDFSRKLRAWEQLTAVQRSKVSEKLVKLHTQDIHRFFADLRTAVTREIEVIRVLPLHGKYYDSKTLQDAISFINSYDAPGAVEVVRYEIEVRYNNGDRIQGQFSAKDEAIRFLRSFEPPPISPASSDS